MKKNFLGTGSLCGLMLALLLSGCTQEDLATRNTDSVDGLTRITLMPDRTEQIVMRSLAGVDENGIYNVWVIQLDASGNVVTDDTGLKLIKQYPNNEPDGKGTITPGAEGKGGTITMRVDPETAEVCFVANTTSNFSGVTNKAGIEAVTKSITNEQSLVTEQEGKNYLPMSGTWTPQAGQDNTVQLQRAVAKLSVTLAFNPETTGDGFALSGIQVKQVANTLQFYRDPDEIETGTYPTLTATTDYTAMLYDGSDGAETEGVVDLATKWGTYYMPTGNAACKGKIIDNSTSRPEFTWYLPENARGTGSATNQWEKNASTAPDGQAAYCTYLEITGFYLTDGLVEEVIYRIYLGGNNTNDFNLLRNHHYILTATIKDKKLVDTRITEYTPQNYIDYTDNDSPWFVAAAREDDNANWQSPQVEEGWSVPSIEQIMVAYAYNPERIYGTNIYWLDKYDETQGRWSINMNIGEVLPNTPTSGDVQSYMLRAVKTYTGSDKYPYVSGENKNIIVSRDENGGAKEEYIRDPATTPWVEGEYDNTDARNRVAKRLEVAPFTTENEEWIRRTWADAKTYCENYEHDGKNDWRMPTQRELMLIYAINDQLSDDYKFRTKTFDGLEDGSPGVHPELAQHIYYWSGTDDSTIDGNAWSVCFCNDEQEGRGKLQGKTEGYPKTEMNFVRPVRDVTE